MPSQPWAVLRTYGLCDREGLEPNRIFYLSVPFYSPPFLISSWAFEPRSVPLPGLELAMVVGSRTSCVARSGLTCFNAIPVAWQQKFASKKAQLAHKF